MHGRLGDVPQVLVAWVLTTIVNRLDVAFGLAFEEL